MLKFMNDNDYHDIGMVGPRYMWCNNKVGSARILEHLDRCLLNSLAIQKIKIAMVRHLARLASDHFPIVLKIFDESRSMARSIKFEDVWLSFKTSEHIVSKTWKKYFVGDDMEILNKKCKRALNDLFHWSKNKLKYFSSEKSRLKAEILSLQEEEATNGWLEDEKLCLLRSKVKELNVILNHLNTWWKQRAKVKWNVEGDSNTKVFHSFANVRRNTNTEDQREVEVVYYSFFLDKWKERKCCLDNWPNSWQVLNEDHKTWLKKELTSYEVKETVMKLGNNKAPGCDGLTHSFFKNFWEIIGGDVCKAVSLLERYFVSTHSKIQ
ncbi:hypothetical protein KFK09_003857 [Dendrobium nobile]|uniref:Reverse transcriptase n=1 Tax=Dendrobium nobile TaxID=94219 RepID=A0A8T3C464_DENNO|nr:hypothetical protein KFK09_003857 [Dendrobium nobile]